MNVNAVKHQAKLLEWKERVAAYRSSGLSVKQWCQENGCSPKTYYNWEREVLGKVRENERTESLPVLTELAIAKPLPEHHAANTSFVPAAVIRFGQVELELSNAVSAELLPYPCKKVCPVADFFDRLKSAHRGGFILLTLIIHTTRGSPVRSPAAVRVRDRG